MFCQSKRDQGVAVEALARMRHEEKGVSAKTEERLLERVYAVRAVRTGDQHRRVMTRGGPEEETEARIRAASPI